MAKRDAGVREMHNGEPGVSGRELIKNQAAWSVDPSSTAITKNAVKSATEEVEKFRQVLDHVNRPETTMATVDAMCAQRGQVSMVASSRARHLDSPGFTNS